MDALLESRAPEAADGYWGRATILQGTEQLLVSLGKRTNMHIFAPVIGLNGLKAEGRETWRDARNSF